MLVAKINRIRVILAAAAAAGLLMGSNPASAQAPQAQPPRPPAQKAQPAPAQKAAPPAGQAAAAQDKGALALTEAQRDQLKSIREQARKDVQALRERQRTARQKLQEVLKAPAYDENAVRAASSALAAVQADRVVLQARIRNQSRKVLTPEQQQRIAARAQRVRRLAKMRNPQMGQPGPGAMGPGAARRRQRMQPGMGQGPGPGMGQGMGPGMGQGMGPGMGQGMQPGMGQGMGPGMGQRMGPGMGQRMGPGFRANMRRLGLWRRLMLRMQLRKNWI
jgi:Spy/CpxP family protein refolding chaperone